MFRSLETSIATFVSYIRAFSNTLVDQLPGGHRHIGESHTWLGASIQPLERPRSSPTFNRKMVQRESSEVVGIAIKSGNPRIILALGYTSCNTHIPLPNAPRIKLTSMEPSPSHLQNFLFRLFCMRLMLDSYTCSGQERGEDNFAQGAHLRHGSRTLRSL